jgi:hypothetical protein
MHWASYILITHITGNASIRMAGTGEKVPRVSQKRDRRDISDHIFKANVALSLGPFLGFLSWFCCPNRLAIKVKHYRYYNVFVGSSIPLFAREPDEPRHFPPVANAASRARASARATLRRSPASPPVTPTRNLRPSQSSRDLGRRYRPNHLRTLLLLTRGRLMIPAVTYPPPTTSQRFLRFIPSAPAFNLPFCPQVRILLLILGEQSIFRSLPLRPVVSRTGDRQGAMPAVVPSLRVGTQYVDDTMLDGDAEDRFAGP